MIKYNNKEAVLKGMHTRMTGLSDDEAEEMREKFGKNKVTHEKKKSLAKRLAGAFINPFTAILFCLSVVSAVTDMIFPYFEMFGSAKEDFDPLTVIMNWTNIWISLFGKSELLGLNMGFWVAMSAVMILVVIMNIVFWGMKPKKV